MFSSKGAAAPRRATMARPDAWKSDILVSALLALLVKLDNAGEWGLFTNLGMEEKKDSVFDHPYALQIWGVAVGFLLVFRGNLGYARFWEARAKLATMSSFLQEVAMCAVCYDEASKDCNQYREWKQVCLCARVSDSRWS